MVSLVNGLYAFLGIPRLAGKTGWRLVVPLIILVLGAIAGIATLILEIKSAYKSTEPKGTVVYIAANHGETSDWEYVSAAKAIQARK